MADFPDPAAELSSAHTLSTDELIRCAVGLARACLGMEVGFVSEFRDGLRIFRHVESVEGFAPIKAGDYDPLDQSYCQRIVDGSAPALIDDTSRYPELAALPVTEQLGIRAHAGVPIRSAMARCSAPSAATAAILRPGLARSTSACCKNSRT